MDRLTPLIQFIRALLLNNSYFRSCLYKTYRGYFICGSLVFQNTIFLPPLIIKANDNSDKLDAESYLLLGTHWQFIVKCLPLICLFS